MNSDTNLWQRIKYLIDFAGVPFVMVVAVFPILLILIAQLESMTSILLWTHIISGLIWFLLVVSSPVFTLLIESSIISGILYNWFTKNIPRLTFLAFGSGLTAVVSGSVLFLSTPSTGEIWRLVALLVGWSIFLLGFFGPNRFHLGVFYEEKSAFPDKNRIKSLNTKNIIIGGFEAFVITLFVIFMNFL